MAGRTRAELLIDGKTKMKHDILLAEAG